MARQDIPWKIRCGAKRRNGLPCRKWAMRGQYRCQLHGGKTPWGLKKGEERLRQVAALALQPMADEIARQLTNPRLQPKTRLALALTILETVGINVTSAQEALEDDPMEQV